MMNAKKKSIKALGLVCLGAICAASGDALARGSGTGEVVTIHSYDDGSAVVQMSAVSGSRPSCVEAGWERYFYLDLNTAAGRAQLAIVTAARLTGQPVRLLGLDSCGQRHPAETIGSAVLE